jgi:hypothetical protein
MLVGGFEQVFARFTVYPSANRFKQTQALVLLNRN